MAEVIDNWPGARLPPAATFEYPWDHWTRVDGNGHGDIWLASRGVDFPATSSASNFRGILYNRANRVTKMRERDAPIRVLRNRVTNQVRRVPDFSPLKVKVQMVSNELVAFQFYDSPEPPPTPQVPVPVVPGRRRPRLHRAVIRRGYEPIPVNA